MGADVRVYGYCSLEAPFLYQPVEDDIDPTADVSTHHHNVGSPSSASSLLQNGVPKQNVINLQRPSYGYGADAKGGEANGEKDVVEQEHGEGEGDRSGDWADFTMVRDEGKSLTSRASFVGMVSPSFSFRLLFVSSYYPVLVEL